ncbi:MAG: exodeoxyribonuclease VII large subunit [bacterium]
MNKALSVTEFVSAVDDDLIVFDGVMVEGEVDEFNISGNKWVRFTLKDKESNVRCFMTVWDLKTEIENGMMVQVTGRPRLTQKWGFSFNLKSVQAAGEGSLKRAFELLRKKLMAEGMFAAERKRILPRFPRHVALITSREAAAYADFLKVLQARMGGLTISFIHTQVQGEDAPRQIIEALKTANAGLNNLDAIVLVRGGGSLEDLQAFNDESVVRAVASSRTPIIVGVGHERDITLAELAADVRASTPSNAAELLVRSREEIKREVEGMHKGLANALIDQIKTRGAAIEGAVKIVSYTLRNRLQTTQQKIIQLQRMLGSLSPQQTLKRGYSITRGADGKILKDVTKITIKDTITTQLSEGLVNSSVIKTSRNNL